MSALPILVVYGFAVLLGVATLVSSAILSVAGAVFVIVGFKNGSKKWKVIGVWLICISILAAAPILMIWHSYHR